MGLIAEANLTAEARKTIEEILAVNTTLADAAVWPDHEGRSIRDFDPLHYVSIPERCQWLRSRTRLSGEKLYG